MWWGIGQRNFQEKGALSIHSSTMAVDLQGSRPWNGMCPSPREEPSEYTLETEHNIIPTDFANAVNNDGGKL